MRYKKLGKTGLDVSVITVGTWAIGGANYGAVNEKDSIDAIHTMFDQGVNMIDTAPAYGYGYGEEVVGRAIKGMRDKVIVATKGGLDWPEDKSEYIFNDSKEYILADCERSLKRLGTDYIDVYIVHWPDPKVPIEETMDAMNILKKSGKIRHIGVSNFTKEQIEQASKFAEIEVIQPPYSMVNTSASELMEWSKRQDLGTMTYGSLGAGILTGAIREMPKFDKDDLRLTFYDYYQEPKFSRTMELLKVLDVYAQKYERPVAQVTINWSTQNPYVDTALMGVRNIQEAMENCAAMDWKLLPEEIAEINKAVQKVNQ